MNARESVLKAIRNGKPDFQPLPQLVAHPAAYPDQIGQFSAVLRAIGGIAVVVESLAAAAGYLFSHFDLNQPVLSLVDGLPAGNTSPHIGDPHGLANLYLTVVNAQMGVAENGAVWVDEQHLPLRALPFLTLHLAVVLREDQLVGNLHDAYRKLEFQTGYGVFIAGPSKTADIEQSLVIGAHGPKSMTVLIIRAKGVQ